MLTSSPTPRATLQEAAGFLERTFAEQQAPLTRYATRLLGDADRARDAEALARLQPGQGGEVRQAPLSKADSLAQQASLAEMRRVSAALNLPWEGLFATLEALPLKDVALLGLTPDARKRLLRISAEARNLEAMLEFHQRLEDSDGLSDVSLLDHEVLVQVAERPIRFNLLATWEVPDGRP